MSFKFISVFQLFCEPTNLSPLTDIRTQLNNDTKTNNTKE